MSCICCNVLHAGVLKSSHEEQSQSVKFNTPMQSISVLLKQKQMINHWKSQAVRSLQSVVKAHMINR